MCSNQVYQVMLALPPQGEQNQGFLAGHQKVPRYRATCHGDGPLRQRDFDDLHLSSSPLGRPAEQVAQHPHPDTGLLLCLRG